MTLCSCAMSSSALAHDILKQLVVVVVVVVVFLSAKVKNQTKSKFEQQLKEDALRWRTISSIYTKPVTCSKLRAV